MPKMNAMHLNEKVLNDLLEKQLNDKDKQNTEPFHLTNEEAEKFKKAFADEEFASLFSDYVKEISDPKNRSEQDEYIRRLEEREKLPIGKKVLKPSPGFVLKFKYLKKQFQTGNHTHSGSKSKKNATKSTKDKLFINIVYSDNVNKPSSEKSTRLDGNETEKGRHWSVPYILGPLRMEEDKGKSFVSTFDCCFHPLSLRYAASNVKFRDLIAATAREGVEQKFKSMNDEIEIDTQYRVLKGVMYKNGEPPVMLIKKVGGNADVSMDSNCSPTSISSTDKKHNEPPSVSRDFGFQEGFFTKDASTKKKRRVKSCDDTKPISCKGQEAEVKVKEKSYTDMEVPEYDLVERGKFEIMDHVSCDNTNVAKKQTRPDFLIYRIKLPDVKTSNDVELELDEDKLLLVSKTCSQSKYRLSLEYPYKVSVEDGIAKFDKDKKTLEVKLPVCTSLTQSHQHNITIDDEDKQKTNDSTLVSTSIVGDKQNENTSETFHGVDHSRWVEEGSKKCTPKREKFAFDGQLPTLSDTVCKDKIIDQKQEIIVDKTHQKDRIRFVKNEEKVTLEDTTCTHKIKSVVKPGEGDAKERVRENQNKTPISGNHVIKMESSTYTVNAKEICRSGVKKDKSKSSFLSFKEKDLAFGLD